MECVQSDDSMDSELSDPGWENSETVEFVSQPGSLLSANSKRRGDEGVNLQPLQGHRWKRRQLQPTLPMPLPGEILKNIYKYLLRCYTINANFY